MALSTSTRVAVTVALAALIAATPARADAERCCFRIEAQASGHADRGGTQVAWRWSLRQVARYVEHGRIFNALTGLGTDGPESALHAVFTVRSSGGCFRRSSTRGFEPVAGAYASLEDVTSGRIALVVRLGAAARSLVGCGIVYPAGAAYELVPPAGRQFREAGAFAVTRELVGEGLFASVRVRFTHFSPSQLRRELAELRTRAPIALARAE